MDLKGLTLKGVTGGGRCRESSSHTEAGHLAIHGIGCADYQQSPKQVCLQICAAAQSVHYGLNRWTGAQPFPVIRFYPMLASATLF